MRLSEVILKDTFGVGNTFNLTKLSQGKNQLTIGRDGCGADILLGQGLDHGPLIYDRLTIITVSGEHAMLTHEKDNQFYIEASSGNRIALNGKPLNMEKRRLEAGTELTFGLYGPVIFTNYK